jgi:hypothetical protein
MLWLLIVILLILALVGGIPNGPVNWGYGPSGLLMVVVVVLLILVLTRTL